MKIVYCSSTKYGQRLAKWLKQQPCELVLENTENQKIVDFPEYDLGISFLYTHRVPSSEFNRARKWVNFHPGPLPEMRGRNLAYHAIMKKMPYFGATVQYMDVNYDTGDIIEVVRFEIGSADTAGDLVEKAYLVLEELFKKYLPKLLVGPVPAQKQEGGEYYKKEPIDEIVELNADQELRMRALMVPPRFYPRVKIGGRLYRLEPWGID